MTAEIINLRCVTSLDLNPDRVLEEAIGRLESVVVVGYDKDGVEYMASSIADGATVNWLFDRLKYRLLSELEE